jgi:hypothetical protein
MSIVKVKSYFTDFVIDFHHKDDKILAWGRNRKSQAEGREADCVPRQKVFSFVRVHEPILSGFRFMFPQNERDLQWKDGVLSGHSCSVFWGP